MAANEHQSWNRKNNNMGDEHPSKIESLKQILSERTQISSAGSLHLSEHNAIGAAAMSQTPNQNVDAVTSHTANASATTNATPDDLFSALPFVFLFFTSMIFHELALEAASTSYPTYPHLASCITLFQFGFCVLLPLIISRGKALEHFPKSFKECIPYVRLSAVVYGATAFATQSLQYEGVTYVTKVVFKSAKLIPTMIVTVVMDARRSRMGLGAGGKSKKRRNYGIWEYGSALLLCVGAAGFCFSPGDLMTKSSEDEKQENPLGSKENAESNVDGHLGRHWIGILLLTTSVFCDALVPNLQEQLMHGKDIDSMKSNGKHQNDDEMAMESNNHPSDGNPNISNASNETISRGISSSSLMINVNAIGFTFLILSMLPSNALYNSILFICLHPQLLLLLLIVGLGLSSAVLAYTELIRRSGPAVAVAVATLRKVVTVILSYVFFPKVMTGIHMFSGGLVFGGILIGIMTKKK